MRALDTSCQARRSGPSRVVVVDDSPTARAYLGELLTEAGFDVVGMARDVAEAERIVRSEAPGLVLSDVELLDGDGIELTRRVLAERGVPIVLITAHDHRHPDLAFRALKAGALEVLPKPPARRSPAFPAYMKRFERTLRTLADVPVISRRRHLTVPPEPAAAAASRPALDPERPAIVAIGASTGGPVLVADLLLALDARRFAFAVVAQHIAPDFAESFRAWLCEHVHRKVLAARDGELPAAGGIYTIPAARHLQVGPSGAFQLTPAATAGSEHVPSIDALFSSLASFEPRRTLAILLSGMGRDGAEGLLALRQAGALTVAQSPSSAAVGSMPQSAIEKGAARETLSPLEISALLRSLPSAETREPWPRTRDAGPVTA